jgi:ABC-type antimicrobial peptide transport system permease subunit
MGGDIDYLAIRRWRLDSGSNFSESAVRSAAKVAILGRTVADQLFGVGSDPVGETIRINKMPFTVVGTLAPKGQNTWGAIRTTLTRCVHHRDEEDLRPNLRQHDSGVGQVDSRPSRRRRKSVAPAAASDSGARRLTVRTQRFIADIMGPRPK